MRLRLALVVAVLAAAILVAAAAASPVRTERVPWVLVDVGPGGRSLVVSYTYGGCDGAARVRVAETARAVRVTLTRAVPAPEANVVCPAFIAVVSRPVHLTRPVAGRHVLGGVDRAAPSGARRCTRTGGCASLVPRVIELWPPDARRLLADQDFGPVRVTGATPRRRVRVQDPRPHSVRHGGGITLRAGP